MHHHGEEERDGSGVHPVAPARNVSTDASRLCPLRTAPRKVVSRRFVLARPRGEMDHSGTSAVIQIRRAITYLSDIGILPTSTYWAPATARRNHVVMRPSRPQGGSRSRYEVNQDGALGSARGLGILVRQLLAKRGHVHTVPHPFDAAPFRRQPRSKESSRIRPPALQGRREVRDSARAGPRWDGARI